LRIVLWLRIGQRFLAALVCFGQLDQGLARTQPEQVIAESSRFGIEPDGLEPVVLRVLHVLALVSGRAFDERSCIQDTQPTFAECLCLSDHLAIIVRVKPITTTVPWHDQDDVPSVSSCGQLHKIIEGAESSVHALLDHGVGRIATLLGVTGFNHSQWINP